MRWASRSGAGIGLAFACAVGVLIGVAPVVAQQQTQAPPVPRPFPQPGQPATSSSSKPTDPPPPATTSTSSSSSSANPGTSSSARSALPTGPQPRPSEAELGNAPVYPAADFLDSYDAGHGQRYYLFGTNAAYADILAYYRKVLGDGGHEIFKAPAMQEFDLGNVKFREDSMSYPPSVVVKDYAWNASDGYLFIDGTKEKRYKTIIQIVPPPKS